MENNPGTDTLDRARDAFARRAWRDTYDLLSPLAQSDSLSPEDLEVFAQSAWWTGRMQDSIDALERVYAREMARGHKTAAAGAALSLSADYEHRRAPSLAAGWLLRAERLLNDESESAAHGSLLRHYINAALGRGDLDRAHELAGKVLDIGNRLGDRDIQALAIHEQGRALVKLGRVDEGMALLDEAAVAAVSGELQPFATAVIYCNVIGACRSLADYRRAGDWTEAAKRWCERQSITGFPGVCRVYRAEIMRLRGAWTDAIAEAQHAADELGDWALDIVGAAFNEIGEIRLRTGDLAAAGEAFQQAHESGHNPQPGLALLMLAQDNPSGAFSSINRALADETWDRLGRARLLPAQVEIALATSDLPLARQAIQELGQIAADFGSPALNAAAETARGSLALAEGDLPAAANNLRAAVKLWQEVDASYEAARTRLVLGTAYRESGDEGAAKLEFESALSAFQRLGAALDVERAARLLDGAEATPAAPLTRQTRTFMLTDICSSTNLLEAIGDEAWEDLLRWHDGMLRECFTAHSGEEIKHGGDGFFVAFPDAASAIDCAIDVQRRLAEHRRDHGFSPQVRIGLHCAEATSRGKDYFGKGVNVAARIGALAGAGEILVSRETAPNGDWNVSQPREVTLKGIAHPVEILTIDWR